MSDRCERGRLPAALEAQAGRLLVHPESLDKPINLRFWFFGLMLPWLTLLAAVAMAASAHREQSLWAHRVWLAAAFTFYMSLACTFFPIFTTPVVALLAAPWVWLEPLPSPEARVAAVALLGAAGTMMANLNDYHLWTFALRHRRVAAVRNTRLYSTAVRWFSRSAWFTLVAFTFIPIPLDVVRLLAITYQYPRWRFAAASFVGRLVRYGIMAAAVASLDRVPEAQLWLVIGVAVLTVGAGLTLGVPRVVRMLRKPLTPGPARQSESVQAGAERDTMIDS